MPQSVCDHTVNAAYVQSMYEKEPVKRYRYGNKIALGSGTSFVHLLEAFSTGNLVYDPGLKLENASSNNSTHKVRHQLRVSARKLDSLYTKFEFVDVSRT